MFKRKGITGSLNNILQKPEKILWCSLIVLFLPISVSAQVICQHVAGCSASNALYNIIPPLGSLFLVLAGAGAVAFVVVGGALMMINWGDDAQVTKGRNSIIYSLLGLVLVLASQVIVSFVSNNTENVADAVDNPVLAFAAMALDVALSLLNTVFVFIIIAAGIRMVIALGRSEEIGKARTMIIWSIIGVLIINVAYSLVRAILNIGL